MDPRSSLPPPLRHAVDQTTAAERLEGWAPTDAHVAELVALACDELSFGEYLGAHRARYPPSAPPPRTLGRVLRRNRPYLLPGSTVLRNNFGAETHTMLADLEYVATAGRLLQWHRSLLDGHVELSVRAMHQHVFGDVYAWAGKYRVTELARGDSGFIWQSDIDREMAAIDERACALAGSSGLDDARLGYELSRLYADYNQVHPFREGNGRTGTLLLHTVAAECGRRLDLSHVSRSEWYAASRDSTPFRRDGRANHRPFIPLLLRAVRS